MFVRSRSEQRPAPGVCEIAEVPIGVFAYDRTVGDDVLPGDGTHPFFHACPGLDRRAGGLAVCRPVPSARYVRYTGGGGVQRFHSWPHITISDE